MKPFVAIVPVSEAPSDLFWGKTYVGSLYAILREELGVEVDLGAAHFWHPREGVDVVLIQWPEALFEWREISDEDVVRWHGVVAEWQRRGTKLVYFRHNFKPHVLGSSAYEALYKAVIERVDAVVHLGQYSRDECLKFDGVLHRVIQHPKYAAELPPAQDARVRLGLQAKAPTLLVYGAIRHWSELKIVLRAARVFRKGFGGQVLLGTAPWHLLGRWARFAGPVRPVVRSVWSKLFGAPLHEGRLTGLVQEDYLAASQFILVPRLDGQLNSGVLIKALSLGITPIATSVGNLAGIGHELGLPMLEDVNEESLTYIFRHVLNQEIQIQDYWKSHSEAVWGKEAIAEPLRKLLGDVMSPQGQPAEQRVAKVSGWPEDGVGPAPTAGRSRLRSGSVIRRLPRK